MKIIQLLSLVFVLLFAVQYNATAQTTAEEMRADAQKMREDAQKMREDARQQSADARQRSADARKEANAARSTARKKMKMNTPTNGTSSSYKRTEVTRTETINGKTTRYHKVTESND